MLRYIRKFVRMGIAALSLCASAAMLTLLLPSGFRALSVQTDSMKPILNPGDLVLVREQPIKEYQPGDIVTFINPNNPRQTITHRIIERADGLQRSIFTTKGDANAVADRPISENLILGKQIGRLPLAGHLINFVRTLPGLMLVIWLPALLVTLYETKRLSNYYRGTNSYHWLNRCGVYIVL